MGTRFWDSSGERDLTWKTKSCLRLIVLGVGFVAKKRGNECEVDIRKWADLVPLTLALFREGRGDFGDGGLSRKSRSSFMEGG